MELFGCGAGRFRAARAPGACRGAAHRSDRDRARGRAGAAAQGNSRRKNRRLAVPAKLRMDAMQIEDGQQQYERRFTDALQFMWGKGFLSPGGPEEVEEMLSLCAIAGRSVLDIGSGLGGVDLLLATKHEAAEVIGIDVEPQLI